MTNIDRAAEIMREADRKSAKDPDVMRYGGPAEHAQALADNGLLMPDLPEPKIDSDGWAVWDSGSVTESAYHPEKGLWTYDDGRMVQDSPERLREVAHIYLAAANLAERNQE